MLNQAVVEALYSATYVENYLDCIENLPNDLQRELSRLRELDVSCQSNKLHFFLLNIIFIYLLWLLICSFTLLRLQYFSKNKYYRNDY